MSDVDPRIDSIVEARIAEGVEARLKEEREKAAHEALTEEVKSLRADLTAMAALNEDLAKSCAEIKSGQLSKASKLKVLGYSGGGTLGSGGLVYAMYEIMKSIGG